MRIHILAIVGKMTTPLAVELQRLGHTVTGSDQDKIYPPASTTLEKNSISVNTRTIDKNIDLVIVGSSYTHFTRCVQELAQAKKLGIPFIPATEYLANMLVKQNSIVVAGSFGKTTITALLAFLFDKLGLDPSYCFGEKIINNLPSVHSSNSDWSIIEGDESINGLDTKAKFFSYGPKYLILTSVGWEHKDSYPTQEANQQAFSDLLSLVPPDGIVVYNPEDSGINQIFSSTKATTVPYENFSFDTSLIGMHNNQNIRAALTLIKALKLDLQRAIELIPTFLGVERRLQIISKTSNITIIDDYAQSAIRVNTAINSIRETFPSAAIKVFFEPHASFLQSVSGLNGFKDAFSTCSEVILSQINYRKSIKGDRVTARSFTDEIGDSLKYIPIYEDIFQHFKNSLKPGDILIHFSSGGLDGLNTLKRLVSHFNPEIPYT
ncbi:hypothetical protein HYV64_03105 [Candidatus Shapirobacteria bacterium]|nr:hypothetical protein [Candidatus Shapirobacteria bacterium]